MTKFRTEGQRIAERRARAAAELSGVSVASPARERNGRAQRPDAHANAAAARETVERAMCQRMGWPFDDAHRARCRGQHMGTLYGRLMEAGRLTRCAYDGIEAFERLRNAYRQQKLDAQLPPRDHRIHDGEPVDLKALKALERDHADAMAALNRMGAQIAQIVIAVIAEPAATKYPVEWPVAYDGMLRVAGHEMAGHFGLRP